MAGAPSRIRDRVKSAADPNHGTGGETAQVETRAVEGALCFRISGLQDLKPPVELETAHDVRLDSSAHPVTRFENQIIHAMCRQLASRREAR